MLACECKRYGREVGPDVTISLLEETKRYTRTHNAHIAGGLLTLGIGGAGGAGASVGGMDAFVLALRVFLNLFLLKARLGDGKEECALEGVLLAMLAEWRLCVRQNVASNLPTATGIACALLE